MSQQQQQPKPKQVRWAQKGDLLLAKCDKKLRTGLILSSKVNLFIQDRFGEGHIWKLASGLSSRDGD